MRGLGIQKTDFADMTPEVWTRLLDVNLHSVLNCTHAVLPAMIAAKRGAIVSIAASRGLARRAGRVDLFGRQGRHHRVQPGAGAGGRPARHPRQHDRARQRRGALEDAPSRDATRSPLGRATSGDDVGRAVAFLLSRRRRHITGACLDVSGGTTLH